jgi:hypothetical protein
MRITIEKLDSQGLNEKVKEWYAKAIPKFPRDIGLVQTDSSIKDYRQSYKKMVTDRKLLREACRRAVLRYQRLSRLVTLNPPEIIIENETRMLGEAIKGLELSLVRFSFRLAFDMYKPPHKHYANYDRWLTKHLKVDEIDVSRFFKQLAFAGEVRVCHDRVAFALPDERASEALKGKSLFYQFPEPEAENA